VVSVVSLALAREAPAEVALLRQDMDPDLYKSLVVHEIAHAYVDRTFRFDVPSVLVHEYIAYTVQLATMPEPLRERVLASIPLPAFQGASEITLTYYALDPNAFGVKCYLHYRDPRNGDAFLERLLSGQVRLGRRPGQW
jgi:hypothetical protein